MRKVLYYLYQYSGLVYRFIHRKICHFVTWYKMTCLCKEFNNFYTAGIPYIEISRRRGGIIIIGDNFSMNNGMANNQIGYGNTPCVLIANNGEIVIGNNVGISQASLIAYNGKIRLGNHTILGGGVKIYTTDFHPIDYSLRRNYASNVSSMQCADVSIGEDSFIGAGSIILKSVTIGDRVIIGAGSVVTKSIPSNSIAAGNPCRVIRTLDT